MGNAHAAISIEPEGVRLTGIAVNGRIDIASLVAIDHFTNDRELTRVERPRQHQLVQRLARIEHIASQIGDLRANIFSRRKDIAVRIRNRNPHVEPAVAIDHVVASLAGQQIAAAAAKQDVMGFAQHVDRSAIGITNHIGLIKHDNAVGFAALPGQRFTRQMVDQHIKTVDPVNTFLGQRVADREERSIRSSNGPCTTPALSKHNIAAGQRIIEVPARQAFNQVVTVTQDEVLLVDEDRDPKIRVRGHRVALVDRPVKPGHAVAALHAQPLEHDVVTGFGVVVGIVAAAIEHVMANDRAVEEQFRVLTRKRVKPVAAFQPVIAFVAHDEAGTVTAVDEVIAFTSEHVLGVTRPDDEVLAFVAKAQIQTFTQENGVVTGSTLVLFKRSHIGTHVGDDIITFAAFHVVDAKAALQVVIAGATPQCVVTAAADQSVIATRPAEHNMLIAGKAQQVIHPVTIGILADHQRAHRFQHRIGAGRVNTAQTRIVLTRLIQLQEEVRGQHQRVVKVRRAFAAKIGIAHRQFSKRVRFELVEHVHALRAAEVIEPVAVLQLFHLHFEHERERSPQQAAKRHLLFSKTADPEVHHVETGFNAGPGALAVEEVQAVSRCASTAHDQAHRRITLGFSSRCQKDRFMLAVGRHKVDDRGRGLEVQRKIEPAGVRLESRVTSLCIEVRTRVVERGNPRIAGPGDVERRQVKRQPDQVVAQRIGHELVDLVTNLTRHPADDRTGCIVRGRTARIERHRIEEGLDQTDFFSRQRLTGQAKAVHRLVQHRVAEAVNNMRKFCSDRRINVDRVREHERIDVGRDDPHELFEHQVLIDLFGRETASLEQALAVPIKRGQIGRDFGNRSVEPFVDEGDIAARQDLSLNLVNAGVVLTVEHRVNGGQADVLVTAAIAHDEVTVEQFIVVRRSIAARINRDHVAGLGVSIRRLASLRIGRVRDVVHERMTRGQRRARRQRCGRIAFHQRIAFSTSHHELRKPIGARDEVAIEIGRQQRHAVHVHIAEFDPQHVTGLRLDVRPSRRTTSGAFQHLAGRLRLAVHHHVFAQEHLVRFMRGINLVEIDPRRGRIDRFTHVISRTQHAVRARLVGRAGQNHEVGRAARNIKRIIRLQRHKHRARTALADEIKAVIEELAKQGHEAIERRRITKVRHDVGDHHVAILDLNARQAQLGGRFGQSRVARSRRRINHREGRIAHTGRFSQRRLRSAQRIGFRAARRATGSNISRIGSIISSLRRHAARFCRHQVLAGIKRTVNRSARSFSRGDHAVVERTRSDPYSRERCHDRNRVGHGLIGHQVGNDPRLAIIDRAGQLFIAGRRTRARVGFSSGPGRAGQTRHLLISSASGRVHQVVEVAAHRAKTIGRQIIKRIAQGIDQLTSSGMVFCNLDLLQNVHKIVVVDLQHDIYSRLLRWAAKLRRRGIIPDFFAGMPLNALPQFHSQFCMVNLRPSQP